MPDLTSTFTPFATGDGRHDAEGQVSSNESNLAGIESFAGIEDKGGQKRSGFFRYNVTLPTTGPPLPTNGRIVVNKIKLTFKVATAGVSLDLGASMIAMLDPDASNDYMDDALGFTQDSYFRRQDLPLASDVNDVINSGVLFENQYWLRADLDNRFVWGTNLTEGLEFAVGGGFPDDFPYGDQFAFAPFTTTRYFRDSRFISGDPTIAFTVDSRLNPVGATERWSFETVSGGTPPILTINWHDMRYNIRADRRSRGRVVAVGHSQERVRAGMKAANRVLAVVWAHRRVVATANRKHDRVSAPFSNARSKE